MRALAFTWVLAHGAIPPRLQVLHHCDNPPCVNPAHLFLGTNADNVADKLRKGRLPDTRGERNANAHLTAALVQQIRDATGSQQAIGARFGVSQSLVSQIKRRVAWAHVT